MKRSVVLLLILGVFVAKHVYAEDTNTAPATTETNATLAAPDTTPAAPPAAPTTMIAVPPAAPETSTPAVAEPAATAPPAAEPVPPTVLKSENANADNLEFVSGEVGELDEAGKTLTVKLYGETEAATTDKTLKVSIDASTDITDGEQDRDFKSLSVGTEVDVEYDPATNKATYIFVY